MEDESINEEPIMEEDDEIFEPQGDESGVSGTGVVIEGVQYATGQVVLHWLTPVPKGSISIFESLSDFKKVHVNPHPDNKTIITWSDGRQEEF